MEPKTKLLEESPGELSIMRVALAGVVASVLGMFVVSNLVMLVNVFVKGTPIALVDIPAGMLGVFTAMVVSKAAQRFGEK